MVRPEFHWRRKEEGGEAEVKGKMAKKRKVDAVNQQLT